VAPTSFLESKENAKKQGWKKADFCGFRIGEWIKDRVKIGHCPVFAQQEDGLDPGKTWLVYSFSNP